MNSKTANGIHTCVSTGNPGLDEVLSGGFTPNRLYLIEGDPGSGKTTLGLQYLLEGVKNGETVMYVTLSETTEELAAVAASHGWSLDGIHVVELVPSERALESDAQYTMFHPSEVELNETTKAVLDKVEEHKPTRIVFDSLSEMRLLAQNQLRYRRQILALKQFFVGRNCTVVLLDDRTAEQSDIQLQSIAHGVLTLEQLSPNYGAERRRLRVMKFRGKRYRGGYHDFVIRQGGIDIFPRLIAAEHHSAFSQQLLLSGNAGLDALMGGGINPGTSTLLIGPAGAGKSSLGMQYVVAAANRGQKSCVFIFDESINTYLTRSAGLGMDLAPYIENKQVTLQQVDPAELSPGEFAGAVRAAVAKHGPRVIVIDSLNGYLNSMPEEDFLTVQMHELLTYLGQIGVNTFLVVAQAGLIGAMSAPIDVSYLADNVILFRYFESKGAIRQAISVIKKRSGNHERTIRELSMSGAGIKIGEPLLRFSGILQGTPTFDE